MDADTFRTRLHEETGEWVGADRVAKVAEEFTKRGWTGNQHLQAAKALLPLNSASESAETDVAISTPDFPRPASTALLVERLRPWAEKVRRELFGSSAVPFPTPEEAFSWLSDAWDHQVHAGDLAEANQKFDELWMEGYYKLMQWADWKGIEVSIDEIQELCPAPFGEIEWLFLPVRADSDYWSLGRALRLMEEATGAPKGNLVMYILTGATPDLPPVTLKVNNPSTVTRPWRKTSSITIQLNVSLTYEELRHLYRSIRDAWPETDTDEQALLRALVAREIGENAEEDASKASWGEGRKSLGGEWDGARRMASTDDAVSAPCGCSVTKDRKHQGRGGDRDLVLSTI